MKANLAVSFLVLVMIIVSCVTPLIDLSLKYDLATEKAAGTNSDNVYTSAKCTLAGAALYGAATSTHPHPPLCSAHQSRIECNDNAKNNAFVLVTDPTGEATQPKTFNKALFDNDGKEWLETGPTTVKIKCAGAILDCKLGSKSTTDLDINGMTCTVTNGGAQTDAELRATYGQDDYNGCHFYETVPTDNMFADGSKFAMQLASNVENKQNESPPGDCEWTTAIAKNTGGEVSLWADIEIKFNGISLKEPEPPVPSELVNANKMLKCSGSEADCTAIFGAKYKDHPLSEYFMSEPTEMSCDVFKVRTPTLKAWMGWDETFDGAADGGRNGVSATDLDNMGKTARARVEWCHATVGFVSTAVGLMSVVVLWSFFVGCFGNKDEPPFQINYEMHISTIIWFITGACLLSASSWTASMVDTDGSDGGFEPGPNQHVEYGEINPSIGTNTAKYVYFYVNGNTGAGPGLITMFTAAIISFIMAAWHAGTKLQWDSNEVKSRGVFQVFMAFILLMGVIAMSTDLFTETYSFNGGDTASGSCSYVNPATTTTLDQHALNGKINDCYILKANKATCEVEGNDCAWSLGNYEYSFDMSIWRVTEKSDIPDNLKPSDIFIGNTDISLDEVSDIRVNVDTDGDWIPWEMHGFIDSCDPAKSKTFWSSSATATAMCRVNKATSIMLIIVPIIIMVMMSFVGDNTARVIMSVLVSVLLLFVTMSVGLTASVYDNYFKDGGANSLENHPFSEKSLDGSFICLCIAMILILLVEVMLIALSCNFNGQKNNMFPGTGYKGMGVMFTG